MSRNNLLFINHTPQIPSRLPRHVAIIMDGNGRWAKQRLLPRYAGHKAGVEAVRQVVSLCAECKIEVLTLFAFSSENWRRPPQEVSLLMELFMTALQREVSKLHKNNVRLRVIGERQAFADRLQQLIADAETLTQNNTGLNLIIAANYGGQWDILEAVKKLAMQVEQGILRAQDLSEEMLAHQLCLAELPEPDLFIRTGGEQRISNFLLWQLAYTELYFTPTLWPDFDKQAFIQALHSFAGRQRRFGRTGEQVEPNA
ncbi:MAG: di-trans,poly-cis-decaprenylcistransferase [Beggiatoa sp. IS2]|nr:MAG: di-trans,poly-cis-decaprenylcistransferase [Beggiatoa sp. IS2]